MSLSDASRDYLNSTSLEKRKQLGQYMTPAEVSDFIFQHVTVEEGWNVLDPAVGTGELLLAVERHATGLKVNLTGWDVDEEVLQVAKKQLPNASLTIKSMLEGYPASEKEKYDFIIGNPPYFELKTGDFNRNSFVTAEGRTNIYGLFFEACIPLLKENGILAFIVPPSMNAGAYFRKLREHILEHTSIEFLHIIRDNKQFVDALTSVQVIVLKKTVKKTDDYVYDFSRNKNEAPTVFTDNKKVIEQAWVGKKSLYDYGYEVVTGNIVWNQYKETLHKEPVEGSSVLYYAKDISKDNKLVLSPKLADKRYVVSHQEPLTYPTILVNRIVGSLDSPTIKAVLVNENSYYGENHVNVIRPRKGITPEIGLAEIHARLVNVPNLTGYLQAVTGNTQLSAKELELLLPL